MDLSVREAASFLHVSTKTLHQWIERGKVPFHREGEHCRFNRVELLEWATARKLALSPGLFTRPDPVSFPGLREVLETGGIHYSVPGTTRAQVLRAAVEKMSFTRESSPMLDKEFILQVLEAREEMGSTAIGDGIAIPHARNPLVFHTARAALSVCFLETPVDFKALDNRPVQTLFMLISPTVRLHLHLLARLGFVLQDFALKRALAAQAPAPEILETVRRLEENFPDESGDPRA